MYYNEPSKNRPWLISAWPGMGNVAVTAAAFLVQKLGMQPVAELAPEGVFDLQQITIHNGVMSKPRLPKLTAFHWKNPTGGRDLYVTIAEAQPVTGTFALAKELAAFAAKNNVGRIVTFASLASQVHPSDDPGVLAAATSEQLIDEVTRLDVGRLQEGQIGGLNGVVLAAAAERNIEACCLLGEIPFFAGRVPNPKTSVAILEAFTSLANIEVDLTDLRAHASAMEGVLTNLMERLQNGGQAPESEFEVHDADPEAEADDDQGDPEVDARIEKMFEEARKDRTKARELKEELDRLHVFNRYENRFLDLFRKVE